MKNQFFSLLLLPGFALMCACGTPAPPVSEKPDTPELEDYPHVYLENDRVRMQVFLPDRDSGLYRATRFDWAGVIGSVRYGGHEYFGYWKDTQDPTFHEDLAGPVEGYIQPGIGYDEAAPGEGFIRIGIGVLEKPDEESYDWRATYPIMNFGERETESGPDWIRFTHRLDGPRGYAYEYVKEIRLTEDGFQLHHRLRNTGDRPLETDQFNHNFFMIDGKPSGRGFRLSFPFPIESPDDLRDVLEIRDSVLRFKGDLAEDENIFINLSGYGEETESHAVTVVNEESGAGVRFHVDRPVHRLVFWACHTTPSPENSVWISVAPGQEEAWTSTYQLFSTH
ncbi:MAG: hypothetical protein R2751_17135 [Bacteroidales bacterium]